MKMDLNALKLGFKQFLEEKTGTKYCEQSASEASIFMNSSEFKDYLAQENIIDGDLSSKSISDILKMDFKNGKLVDNEEGGNVISGEKSAEYASMTDMINDILEDEDVMDFIDGFGDGDGDLSTEEVQAFLQVAAGVDGNEDNLTAEDLLSAVDLIKNGDIGQVINDLSTDSQERTQSPKSSQGTQGSQGSQSSSPSVSGSNGSGNVSGGNSGGNWNSGNAGSSGSTGNTQNTGKSTGMSLEEIEKQIQEKEGELSDKQGELSAVQDGSDSEIAGLKEAQDEAFDAFNEAVEDEEVQKELEEAKNTVDEKQTAVGEAEQTLSECQTNESSAKTDLDNANSTVQALEAAVAAASDKNKGDVQSQLDSAKAAADAAQQAYDEAQEATKEAEEALETAQKELEEAQTALDEKMEEVAENDENLKQLKEAYDTAKEAFETGKAEKTQSVQAEVDSIQNDLNDLKTQKTQMENAKSLTGMAAYDEETAKKLMDQIQYAGTVGWCLRDVSADCARLWGQTELNTCNGANETWQYLSDPTSKIGQHVTDVTEDWGNKSLHDLPAGCIVVFEGSNSVGGMEWGHIIITDGEGGEYADHHYTKSDYGCSMEDYYQTPYHIYVPNGN